MALDHPGHIQEDVIGGRVRVRVAFENGASGLLYVAINTSSCNTVTMLQYDAALVKY